MALHEAPRPSSDATQAPIEATKSDNAYLLVVVAADVLLARRYA